MEREFEVMETTIRAGRTLRIRDGKSLELKVVTGCLWVTYEDDPADFVLSACDTIRIGRNGLTLAHAAKEVQLRITYPVAAGGPSMALGAGYREFGGSIVRSMIAGWLRGTRARVSAPSRERAAPSGRLGMPA